MNASPLAGSITPERPAQASVVPLAWHRR